MIIIVAILARLVNRFYVRYMRNHFTERIGNLVDAWYFGSLGSKKRQMEFFMMQRCCSIDSFGYFLKLDFSLQNHLDSSTLSTLVKAADNFWASYDYNNITKCIHQYQSALRHQMLQYAKCHRPELLRPQPYDCIL